MISTDERLNAAFKVAELKTDDERIIRGIVVAYHDALRGKWKKAIDWLRGLAEYELEATGTVDVVGPVLSAFQAQEARVDEFCRSVKMRMEQMSMSKGDLAERLAITPQAVGKRINVSTIKRANVEWWAIVLVVPSWTFWSPEKLVEAPVPTRERWERAKEFLVRGAKPSYFELYQHVFCTVG